MARDPAYIETLMALDHALHVEFPGRVAVVSSFGVESAVLLALVAEVDPSVPVLFLETGRHFAETLAYRAELAAHLKLTGVRDLVPDAAALAAVDPNATLAGSDPDACCFVRKVAPLEAALSGFNAWISGRKRHQSSGRATLPAREWVDGRVKFNPLAGWSAAALAAEHRRRKLPTHPLAALGYRSVGCAPCTRAVLAGEDDRAGRWAGTAKTECGIHRSADGRLVRAGGSLNALNT